MGFAHFKLTFQHVAKFACRYNHAMPTKAKIVARGVKRGVGDETTKPVHKQPRVDPSMQLVKDVIESAQNIPESCKAMLVAIVPSTLCVPKDERVAFQTRAVEMI